METLKKLWTMIKHNQGIAISFGICIPLLVWFYGCQSETHSIIHPDRKVTEPELKVEYAAEIRRIESELEHLKEIAELRMQDIQRQDMFKAALYQNAMTFAANNTVNPIAILSTLGSILGIGAVIDNRRKDMLIKTLKTD